MRVVIQRVSSANVEVDHKIVSEINAGFLLLVGIMSEDGVDDIEWLVKKCIGMRIFSDEAGKMNDTIVDINGSFLAVSQFTLYASTKKGNRPSFINAARPDHAVPMYDKFCSLLAERSGLVVKKGIFGADMKVSLVNDGPVTILLDSKNKA